MINRINDTTEYYALTESGKYVKIGSYEVDYDDGSLATYHGTYADHTEFTGDLIECECEEMGREPCIKLLDIADFFRYLINSVTQEHNFDINKILNWNGITEKVVEFCTVNYHARSAHYGLPEEYPQIWTATASGIKKAAVEPITCEKLKVIASAHDTIEHYAKYADDVNTYLGFDCDPQHNFDKLTLENLKNIATESPYDWETGKEIGDPIGYLCALYPLKKELDSTVENGFPKLYEIIG